MTTENYPTFRKELGMKELSKEAMDKVKSEIANGKYDKDQVIEKIYESE
jgi:hypothetical protein